ncbi:MAG: DUF480 domain-containing protein [Acidobacteria bacterium]|nr:MAG: DUF480 domain-containing protein [Acidobacteriota bacterium]
MARTRSLDAIEIRVLGALMEKEQTTPDHYPLTINGVIAACNQKSNREPVMKLTETEVVEALDRLAADVLAWRNVGPRSERWEHRLDRRWNLDRPKKAVMTLLLLRGAQTAGELRGRSERLHRFAGVAEVEAVLGELASGPEPLVRQLPRLPGKRETRWIHLVGDEAAEEALTAAAAAPPPSRAGDEAAARLDALEKDVADLRRQLAALAAKLEG